MMLSVNLLSISLLSVVIVTVLPPSAPAKTNPPVSEKLCVAVMASFPEELAAIEKTMIPDPAKVETSMINGITFHTAEIDGRRFVFFLTGMSLVNAAGSTQLAIDRFNVQAVFFTGIAGGVNPAFAPGDVVIPARWRYHGETVYLNETGPGKYELPGWYPHQYPNFGMIHPDDVQVTREGVKGYERVPAFPADERLLALAKGVAASLPTMTTGERTSRVNCGGTGVSGTVFCDNADYRKWVFATFQADCLDMESAAIAQVCWQNEVPCLIVRGLSDLAGGQTGKNQMGEFLKAAADHSALVLVRILQAYTPATVGAAATAPAAP